MHYLKPQQQVHKASRKTNATTTYPQTANGDRFRRFQTCCNTLLRGHTTHDARWMASPFALRLKQTFSPPPNFACPTSSKHCESPKRTLVHLQTDVLNTKPKRTTATLHVKTDW